MKYLVTGGAGFIGSNLVDELVNKGHEVVIIDNESAESNSEFYWNKNAKKYLNDINDFSSLNSIFSEEKPDMVFHLAAEARIQPTINEPHKACLTNFVGTCNVLQASRENGVKRVIYSSTSSAYGLKNKPPLNEEMPKDCLNPYSVSKTAGEELCKVYYKIYGLETITLRYFNVYGNREPIKGPYAPVVGLFIRQKKEGKPFTVVGDGQKTRDFTHIDDIVDGLVRCVGKEHKAEEFELGSGVNYSINEIAELFKCETKYIPARSGEYDVTLCDYTKAEADLGYQPKGNIKTYVKQWLEENK